MKPDLARSGVATSLRRWGVVGEGSAAKEGSHATADHGVLLPCRASGLRWTVGTGSGRTSFRTSAHIGQAATTLLLLPA